MPRGKGEGITKIVVKGFKSIAKECEIRYPSADDPCWGKQFWEIQYHAAALNAKTDVGGTL